MARALVCALAVAAVAPGASGFGFTAQPTLHLPSAALATRTVASQPRGHFVQGSSRTRLVSSAPLVSTLLAAALALAARGRSKVTLQGINSSLSVRDHLTANNIKRIMSPNMAVRQWAPVKIPAHKRRKPEDRIRLELFSNEPHQLLETLETLQDYVAENGGDLEGPIVQQPKRYHVYANKSPNGHSKSKYKIDHWEFYWLVDLYPPEKGGLGAVMKLRLPHRCRVRIL
ncbi:unnamed protein product [Prorocentrum cordatum]|uniref:Small ribosomal subunit protein uS10 domain-containing protein n=1 Tax=Prorocentrum cordatum TaxID=2364126 RepID=A0ABN9TMM6_9DINO|nr:unnamed protein product [Polarella glacialis]